MWRDSISLSTKNIICPCVSHRSDYVFYRHFSSQPNKLSNWSGLQRVPKYQQRHISFFYYECRLSYVHRFFLTFVPSILQKFSLLYYIFFPNILPLTVLQLFSLLILIRIRHAMKKRWCPTGVRGRRESSHWSNSNRWHREVQEPKGISKKGSGLKLSLCSCPLLLS